MQAGGSNWQTVSTDIGKSWSDPTGINLSVHNGTSVGPGRGLQLSEKSPAPGRILFIGHHGPYEVSNTDHLLAGEISPLILISPRNVPCIE